MISQTFDFYHGYSLFQEAITKQEASTLATAEATLPVFQQALVFFQNSKGYMDAQATIDYNEYISNSGVYIEIQEAIIKRGR